MHFIECYFSLWFTISSPHPTPTPTPPIPTHALEFHCIKSIFRFWLPKFRGLTKDYLCGISDFCKVHNKDIKNEWVFFTEYVIDLEWYMLLTHWGRDKMAGISQTTIWNAFSWMKIYEHVWISINISLKFVPKGRINNIPALVKITAWHRPGDKPLSEPMMVRLPTHICISRPQWVNIRGQRPISVKKCSLKR